MIVSNYVTESGYTEDIQGRTKVGDTQARVKVAILNVETGEVKWVDHGQKIAAPAAKAEKPEEKPKEQDRDVELDQPVWSEDGAKAVLLARAADNKDRWILRSMRRPARRAWWRTIMMTLGWMGRAPIRWAG